MSSHLPFFSPFTRKAIAVATMSLLSATTFAADKAFVTVNGQSIPASQVENLVKAQGARGTADSPELRNAIQNQLVTLELLAQEAKKRGFEKKPEVQAQVAMVTKEILQQALVDDYLRAQVVTEAELKAEYDRMVTQNAGRQEFSVRHILVATEAEALDIIKKLGKGEKFFDLAKQSKDLGNAANGGDLGWHAPSDFVPPFAIAMTKLTKGQSSQEPVKTEFGFHVLQMDDVRPVPIPSFEKTKQDLQNFLLRQKVNNLVRELRSKAKIQIAQ